MVRCPYCDGELVEDSQGEFTCDNCQVIIPGYELGSQLCDIEEEIEDEFF